MKIWKYMFCR